MPMAVEQMQGATYSAHRCCLFWCHSAKLFHFRTLVVRAVSICDSLTAVMMQGEEIKGLRDRRFMCL